MIDEPLSEEERRAVARWRYIGQSRPKFAWIPAPGQESVWDYPRPPRLEPDAREVLVKAGEQLICRTRQAMRVLETASPPTFYVAPDTVQTTLLVRAPGSSRCEWKGEAVYWSLARNGADSAPVAWSYPRPTRRFAAIAAWFAFYPSRVECRVDGIRVLDQPGGFYGGWITPEIVGPFKGEPGSSGW